MLSILSHVLSSCLILLKPIEQNLYVSDKKLSELSKLQLNLNQVLVRYFSIGYLVLNAVILCGTLFLSGLIYILAMENRIYKLKYEITIWDLLQFLWGEVKRKIKINVKFIIEVHSIIKYSNLMESIFLNFIPAIHLFLCCPAVQYFPKTDTFRM